MIIHQSVLLQRGCLGFVQFCFHYELVLGGCLFCFLWVSCLFVLGVFVVVLAFFLSCAHCSVLITKQAFREQVELEFLMPCGMQISI